jgi:hypothetical protein
MTDEVRGFNLLYTRQIGLMNRRLPATDLPEAHVLCARARSPFLQPRAALDRRAFAGLRRREGVIVLSETTLSI